MNPRVGRVFWNMIACMIAVIVFLSFESLIGWISHHPPNSLPWWVFVIRFMPVGVACAFFANAIRIAIANTRSERRARRCPR